MRLPCRREAPNAAFSLSNPPHAQQASGARFQRVPSSFWGAAPACLYWCRFGPSACNFTVIRLGFASIKIEFLNLCYLRISHLVYIDFF
jgi:hypothetical protein